MATAAEQRRLIEGIAFIRTHRKRWQQEYWVTEDSFGTCGTVGCLAGHIATTLNPHTPAVKVPTRVWQKIAERQPLTDRERDLVDEARSFSDWVRATGTEINEGTPLLEQIDGRPVQLVHVRERAARLIGQSSFTDLFRGLNKLNDIYRIAAESLGLTTAELKRECDKVAAEKGWNEQKASA